MNTNVPFVGNTAVCGVPGTGWEWNVTVSVPSAVSTQTFSVLVNGAVQATLTGDQIYGPIGLAGIELLTVTGTTVYTGQAVLVSGDVRYVGVGEANPPPNFYNILDYGADPTGVNDSTGAIQQAVDYCGLAGGGIVFLPAGSRYLVSSPISITAENVHVMGPGWSMPKPGATNTVSRGTPLATLTPSASFTANSPVLDFNNTSYMINGCSVSNLSIDFSKYATSTTNVQGIHFGNASFFSIDNVVLVGPTGSGILIDQAGATYSNPSTSQIFLSNLNIYSGGNHGIEFPAGLFMSEVYIHDFYIFDTANAEGIYLGQSTGAFDIHIYDGAIDTASTGIYCGTYETFIHDVMIYACWNNGIEFASTANYGYMSKFHDNIIRDCDRSANGSAGITVDTGSYDLILSNNICEKVNGSPEYGIVVVDGADSTTHNVYLDRSNYCVGNSVANYKSGSVEVTATRYSTGAQTAPAIPASGTALTNPFPFDCTVAITGTCTVTVGGIEVASISGGPSPVFLAAGQTITLTYTTAPTWAWTGH